MSTASAPKAVSRAKVILLSPEMSPEVEMDVQRILDAEARRLLDEAESEAERS